MSFFPALTFSLFVFAYHLGYQIIMVHSLVLFSHQDAFISMPILNLVNLQHVEKAASLKREKKYKLTCSSYDIFSCKKCIKIFSDIFIPPSSFQYIYIQGVSRLQGITAGVDFLGLCDQKSSYKHVSDFGRLRSYDRLNLGIEG